jgi:hypothetical protein
LATVRKQFDVTPASRLTAGVAIFLTAALEHRVVEHGVGKKLL